jgi:antitoxin (DNA-binding transcriptional repressor) of toxin-antitoxin stability system
MRTATVADLRNNFRRISAWLDNGEQVEITKRGRRYAFIQACKPPTAKKFKMPDFAARRKAIWGDRPPLTDEQVQAIRDWEDNEP